METRVKLKTEEQKRREQEQRLDRFIDGLQHEYQLKSGVVEQLVLMASDGRTEAELRGYAREVAEQRDREAAKHRSPDHVPESYSPPDVGKEASWSEPTYDPIKGFAR